MCSTCRKARLECVYQEPLPRKRKRKTVDSVHERLEHYEKLLKQNGLIEEEESNPPPTPAQKAEAPFLGIQGVSRHVSMKGVGDGKLLPSSRPGRSRYIDSNVWKNLGEFHPSSDEEDADDPSPAGLYRSPTTDDPVSTALLGPNSPPVALIDFHPTYESAMKLWKIYVDNIDPIIKLVHVPSGVAIVQRAAANPSSASKATEALLFAVYHFAAKTITEAECERMFGEPQVKLVARYHDAVRQALVNAHFLRTTDLMTLQAYMLFLLSIRSHYDPHTFWILTGIAVRLAQRMGLHRDGEALGLKPFDVQIRRRVFWQILPLDGMAGQLCGTGISISPDSWDVLQPLNLNDTDIWPEMTETPQPRTGATDMIFCLARTTIAKFIQKANPPMGNVAKVWAGDDIAYAEKQLDEVEDEMELKYLRYCDWANPIHIMTMGMIRGSLCSGKLRLRLSRAKRLQDVPDDERRQIWSLAMRMIDYDISTYENNLIQVFKWHLKAFFQWDPLIWILNEIRRHPQAHEYDPDWSKIEKMYSNHPELMSWKGSLHVATSRLVLKTWETWQASRPHEEVAARGEPSFITTLRSQAQRREVQTASLAASTEQHDPFAVGDATDDLPDPNVPFAGQNNFDFDYFSNPESMDWMFWDQLIRDPTSFSTS